MIVTGGSTCHAEVEDPAQFDMNQSEGIKEHQQYCLVSMLGCFRRSNWQGVKGSTPRHRTQLADEIARLLNVSEADRERINALINDFFVENDNENPEYQSDVEVECPSDTESVYNCHRLMKLTTPDLMRLLNLCSVKCRQCQIIIWHS